ncbi:histidine kinase [Nocardia sp. NPDC088792]|uniref:histidine kinase n=1 Tax=Nocardia sp. NPDC088792 TaxID=3364332 RepID=UPI0037F19DF5
MLDVSKSLAWQSLLLAVTVATADAVTFVSTGLFGAAPAATLGFLVAIVVADLALAAPAGTAGWVAVLQVCVRMPALWFITRHGGVSTVADVGYLIAGYRAGAWLTVRPAVLTLGVLVAGVGAGHFITQDYQSRHWPMVLSAIVGVGVVPWLVGRYTTARRAYIDDLKLRAQRRVHEERAALERAITAEREAIARDLHDAISHHVSAIGIHAGAARMALTMVCAV